MFGVVHVHLGRSLLDGTALGPEVLVVGPVVSLMDVVVGGLVGLLPERSAHGEMGG